MEVDDENESPSTEKCRNPECSCEVERGHPYCSEYCRSAVEYVGFAEGDASGCNCGHGKCPDQ